LVGPRVADNARGLFLCAGVATSSQIQKNGIDGFAVQVSGSVTINNASNDFICAGDWVSWTIPMEAQPSLTIVGVPPQKALARLAVFSVLKNTHMFDAATGNLLSGAHPESAIIGRALTNATQCQEFDIMLHG